MAKKQTPETRRRLFQEQAEAAIRALIATVEHWPNRFPQPGGAVIASLVRLLEQTPAIAERVPRGRAVQLAFVDFTTHIFGWHLTNPGRRYAAWQHVPPSELTRRLGAWTGIESQHEVWDCYGPMVTLPNGDDGISVSLRGLRILAAKDERQLGARGITTQIAAA